MADKGTIAAGLPAPVEARARTLLAEHQNTIWARTDRLFAGLLVFQWIAGIVLALWRSPRTWDGAASHINPHLLAAVFLGLVIIALPIYAALRHPGRTWTRHIIAVGQMLSSALLIHLGDGRIEMHFHVFGSLAFLAFYRDWRVMISASAVVALDHLFRGIFLPESVYGVISVTAWRTFEHAGWVIFEDLFLITSCVQGVREMRQIAERQALLEESHKTVEEKVRERTRQLKDAQDDLLKVARSAGMAEIATSVLHNVGNVLNSVNVSVDVARNKVRQSPVGDLSKAVAMLTEHKNDAGYLRDDERGRQLPGFLEAVAELLSSEQTALLEEMGSLANNVEHIKQIVAVQQSHAKHADMSEEVNIVTLTEDAIRVCGDSLERAGIQVVREMKFESTVFTDKHTLMQILINLISNAKQAVLENPPVGRRITIRAGAIQRDGESWLRLDVIDNGVGIPAENMARVFHHGFTTKKDGHGFGLHASANSAQQVGGSLTAHSEGSGRGATFTLQLPLKTESVRA